ncbi:hypothetical protein KIN20_007103 [Parelaphostrongylus tenuis]|uniref:Uncharacterized protein n=1 Tax=Parelaphostrongylus tenuis TaxID=148309 RepID=A0AAD5MV41_PARTN|nr:hypothetical protein KIN20_007103 [Parelaphostrongylus tenuis]
MILEKNLRKSLVQEEDDDRATASTDQSADSDDVRERPRFSNIHTRDRYFASGPPP